MRAILSATILMLLASTSTVSAQPVPPSLFSPSQQQMLAAALSVARAAWPASPCRGREVVVLDAGAVLLAAHGASIAGDALLDGSCQVRIAHIDGYVEFCSTLVHELGHQALGARAFEASNPADPAHSPDPASIMFGPGPVQRPWSGCRPSCPWGQVGDRCERAIRRLAMLFPNAVSVMPAYMRKLTVNRRGGGYVVRVYMRSGRSTEYRATLDWAYMVRVDVRV